MLTKEDDDSMQKTNLIETKQNEIEAGNTQCIMHEGKGPRLHPNG